VNNSNKRFVFGLCIFLFSVIGGNAQDGYRVSGVIRDINTHISLRTVNIFVKGQNIGGMSDAFGKFSLFIPNPTDETIIVFKHIAYYQEEISLTKLKESFYVGMRPRVIPLQGVEIEGKSEALEIEKDMPQTVSVIEAKDYEMRGYVDAGDLLKIDHSVQVEEKLSGQKNITIRGGNADEVVVMYNGVKMNNAYDNVFDFSLIDLESVERFELIKGSNTALYGPEAFSGVVNIVPKVNQDYSVRFQQRLGTYRSGNWGLHLHRKIGNLTGSYRVMQGGQTRFFLDNNTKLENSSLHHIGNLSANLGSPESSNAGILSAMAVYSALDYNNHHDDESVNNSNILYSVKFSGKLFGVNNLNLTTSYKQLEESQLLTSQVLGDTSNIDRSFSDMALLVNAEKVIKMENFDWLFSYQFQGNELDFLDVVETSFIQNIGLESADLQRNHHGFVSIVKYHGKLESGFWRSMDVDASVRHDRVRDRQNKAVLRGDGRGTQADFGSAGLFGNNTWNETTVKFALDFSGYQNDIFMNSHLIYGRNTKFPTLFQQISSPVLWSSIANQPKLMPEKNASLEMGFKLGRDIESGRSVTGWELSGNFFQNQYENKFRLFTTPRIPVSFFDNEPTAKISGFESKASVYFLKNKVSLDLAVSKYFISDKAAFPFKSDHKRIFNFNVAHKGYAFQAHLFYENDQVGWLRPDASNGINGNVQPFTSIPIPGQSNIDLHLSKTFRLFNIKLFANASGRNLIKDEGVVLEGIAIKDRRFYLTFGAQL